MRTISSFFSGIVWIRSGSQYWNTLQPMTASAAFREMAVAVFSQLSV